MFLGTEQKALVKKKKYKLNNFNAKNSAFGDRVDVFCLRPQKHYFNDICIFSILALSSRERIF